MENGVDVNFDLESTPLEIKTKQTVGWNYVSLYFNGVDSEAIFFDFDDPPQYFLGSCLTSNNDFSSPYPTEAEKIWRILKHPGPRLVIQCNEQTLLNFTFSDDSCENSEWNTTWNSDVTKIRFKDRVEEVSEFYRPGAGRNKFQINNGFLSCVLFSVSCIL